MGDWTQAAAELSLGASEVLPQGGLEAKLAEAAKAGRPLRVKLGFDPTKPDLHLGHAVVLNGLRRFQQAGHQVVLIVGDFTATIGDPTGKDAARPPLTAEEVAANAQTYMEQLGLVVELAQAEVHRNGDWLRGMDLGGAIGLMARATVAQMLARENFAKRYERGDAIALHEFLYPLLQGQDSVAIRADVELGGSDQKFNNLMGRQLQEAQGQAPQVVVLYPILEGVGTTEKMSKSADNYVGLTDEPKRMWDRLHAIEDRQIVDYLRMTTGLPGAEVLKLEAELESKALTPMAAKRLLAHAVVKLYHGAEAAERLQGGVVDPTADLPQATVAEALPIARLLVEAGLAQSTSMARQRLKDGAAKRMALVDGALQAEATYQDPNELVAVPPEGLILALGKKLVRVSLAGA